MEILILIVSGPTVLFQDIEKALILLLLFCPGDSNGVGDGTARPSLSAKCQSRVHAQPPMPLPAARQNCATPQRGASWQQPGLPKATRNLRLPAYEMLILPQHRTRSKRATSPKIPTGLPSAKGWGSYVLLLR